MRVANAVAVGTGMKCQNQIVGLLFVPMLFRAQNMLCPRYQPYFSILNSNIHIRKLSGKIFFCKNSFPVV